LADVVRQFQAYGGVVAELEQARQLAEDPRSEPTFRDLALEEARVLEGRAAAMYESLRLAMIPKDARDEKNIFLEIRAGTGGGEAALFAAELFRMYGKYAEAHRWRVELVSSNETGIGGMKEAIALIEGKGAYSRLKFESGVHRVQRVPVTEASGRIHTSTVTVAVVPEAEEVEYHIDAKDLRIDTFCSSGPGGQSVNTTYSAVRITHIPTNTVVNCQDERSQTKNRVKAMRILRSRLMEVERERQEAEIAKDRKAQVGSGERSEKIRTYNFPQNRVTDHRIGLTLHRLDQVLNGDLDELINALQAWTQAAQLQRL
jgi:peptide chain release factor 1